MKNFVLLLMAAVIMPLMVTSMADARQAFRNDLIYGPYPALVGTKFQNESCLWCHVENWAGPRNPYGLDIEAYFNANGNSDVIGAALSIEQLDSDGDGYSNIQEINAVTWPGFSADYPADITCTDADGDNYFVESGCGTSLDCNDNSSAISPGATEACTDGIDNDCDGNIDCADADCTISCSPTSPEFCNDKLDNDGDKKIDCADRDCRNDPACTTTISAENTRKLCNDAKDNDGDGAIDCADTDCAAYCK